LDKRPIWILVTKNLCLTREFFLCVLLCSLQVKATPNVCFKCGSNNYLGCRGRLLSRIFQCRQVTMVSCVTQCSPYWLVYVAQTNVSQSQQRLPHFDSNSRECRLLSNVLSRQQRPIYDFNANWFPVSGLHMVRKINGRSRYRSGYILFLYKSTNPQNANARTIFVFRKDCHQNIHRYTMYNVMLVITT